MAFVRSHCAIIIAFAVVFTLAPRATLAQYNTAEIGGVVTDPQGAVLPGATISAIHAASGVKTERVSDGEGRFFLPALPVGEYTLTVTLPGFKQFTRTGLNLQVGQKVNLPITLDVGEISETVRVNADAPLLQTADAEVSDVIDNNKVVELPLNGRQFLQLSLLSDGVVVPPGGTRGGALEQAGALPAVLGQRSGHNIYLLDGVKVTDEYFNNLVISPSVDAIQEFKIQKTLYPAEFGGKASALINVVTKSGSNLLHGSAVEFLRNDKFDARNYFDDPTKPIPPLRQNQFGATLGGPIRRDRMFFFLSYEGHRIRRSLTQTFSVPPAEMRTGNFAGLAPLCDPLTRTAGGCTTFANNQIPSNRLDPVAIALLQKVPAATSAGSVQNLLAVDALDNRMNQSSLRIDHALSPTDNIFGRFSTYDVREVQPFGTSSLNEALVPGFGRTVSTKARNLGVSYVHTFSPRFLNEVRFGYLSASGGQSSPNQGVNFAAASELDGVTRNAADMGYPQVSFGGLFSTVGDPTTVVSRNNRSYELYDNVLLDRGAHHLKFGGYLFRLEFNPVNPQTAFCWVIRVLRRWVSAAQTKEAAARGSTCTDRMTGRSNQTSRLTTACVTRSTAR
ncbi:MAG: hypothetical protein DMG11_21530 [Acidobacteria bacterium]|nr:MAG: hypothetical protein DMG11_21530 [Acidobacteriota bacterium]